MIPKRILIPVLLIIGLSIFVWYLNIDKPEPQLGKSTQTPGEISYVAIGDSYTIGLGITEEGRWPNVLVNHLREQGLMVNLVANPAVSGYTVQDAITEELPVVREIKPDFVTVLIGANDSFSGTDSKVYEQDLQELLDKLQPMLKNPKNIVLITIPDYSRSPATDRYDVSGVSESIEEYNQVIKNEVKKRDLKVADIFPVSQTMTGPGDYISDGLHPSAQGYAKWEKEILPVVRDLLKEAN